MIKKLILTIKDFKKTAYHHYGNSPLSIFKFLYYSGIRINTFIVFENDLTQELPDHNLEPYYTVVKPKKEELNKIREGKNLPREFYYDEIYNAKTCYLTFKGNELAHIYWVFFKGDCSRFLILSEGMAEVNYNTTLPKFRGNRLMAKMMAYISKDLKEAGYRKVMGVIHEFNYPAIKSAENAGFKKIAKIRALGPIHRKLKI